MQTSVRFRTHANYPLIPRTQHQRADLNRKPDFRRPRRVQFSQIPELQTAKGTVVDGCAEYCQKTPVDVLAPAVDLVVLR